MNLSRVKFDILSLKPVRGILMSSAFPIILQTITLIGIIFLAANGLGIGAEMKGQELRILRRMNLTTLVVWGLWWPAMIMVTVAFGRVWCTICPMEMVNRFGHAVARRIGWSGAKLGRIFKNGWFMLILYVVMQLVVVGFIIQRVPHYTAIFLLVILGTALVTGLIFRESRSFCRGFCPAGALLSVYSRYTPFQLESRESGVCDSCRTKDCVRSDKRACFDKRSCPSLLAPFRRKASDGCVLCFQCAKVCPHGNMGFGLVSMSAPVRRKAILHPFEAVFVMIALGFVTHEVVAEVKWVDDIFHMVPAWLSRQIPLFSFKWMETFWFLCLFPLIVWSVISGIACLVGYRGDLKMLLRSAATGAAPIVAMAHLAKAAAKVTSWGEFLPLSIRDPKGLETFLAYTNGKLILPPALVDVSIVGLLMLLGTTLVAWRALVWARDISEESIPAARSALIFTFLFFTSVLTTWTLGI